MSSLPSPIEETTEDAFPAPLPEFARDLPLGGAMVQSRDTNQAVMDLFEKRAEIGALVVEEDDKPIGLINRNIFNGHFAKPFHRELYGRKSCIAFMDKSPLRIEADTPIHTVAARAAEMGAKVVNDGFIVTQAGKALGLVNGVTLLRTMASLQEAQHKHLMSSIHYASTIQRALLSDSRQAITSTLGDNAALVWEPRDIVGGDCFFAKAVPDGLLVGLVDCTGHGVPGAFLTSIAVSELNRITAQSGRLDPGAVLTSLNERVKSSLNQKSVENDGFEEADDGMDAVFAFLDFRERRMKLSSAKLPIFIQSADGGIETIKGERKGIGYRDTPLDQTWQTHELPMEAGSRLYLATDGVSDQIGSARKIAFGWQRFKASIAAGREASPAMIVNQFHAAFLAYQDSEFRRDDVTMLCIELTDSLMTQGKQS